MSMKLRSMTRGQSKLLDSPFKLRYEMNVKYVMSLQEKNLLRSFYLEAGLYSYSGTGGTTLDEGNIDGDQPGTWHWGWEAVTSELRGHFMGHWLSAAAMIYVQSGDNRVKAKADYIVSELGRCQIANGGEWVGPFPEKFLKRLSEGSFVWAPQYTLHKLFMGLLDMYKLTGNEQALDIMNRFAAWFHRWTNPFSEEEMADILDFETGGMLEIWAELYHITKQPSYSELMNRYDRRRFFDRLLSGEDPLTNKHANTQIPEILGASRSWEATGELRWRAIVEAFWQSAVEDRGCYCTGGVSCGEVWNPPNKLSARLGSAQEHCTVYNMMRLASDLYRWTGDTKYADYWERNLYNGVLAQQHPHTGMVSYFLNMQPGSRKKWGSRTGDFWCCHGSLVQAQASYDHEIFHEDDDGIIVSQYIPSQLQWKRGVEQVQVVLKQEAQQGVAPMSKYTLEGLNSIQHLHINPAQAERPAQYVYQVSIKCEQASRFKLKLRIPGWVKGDALVTLNGKLLPIVSKDGYGVIDRIWENDTVQVEFPTGLSSVPLPDRPDMVAFTDGPLVLAGLVGEERILIGDKDDPTTLLIPDNERHHGWWNTSTYRTKQQAQGIRFIPLCEIVDESYSVYFPISKQ